jgi:hypothetical protein
VHISAVLDDTESLNHGKGNPIARNSRNYVDPACRAARHAKFRHNPSKGSEEKWAQKSG